MEPDIRQKMTFDECVKVFLRQDYLYFAATAIVSSETNKDMAFAITTGDRYHEWHKHRYVPCLFQLPYACDLG